MAVPVPDTSEKLHSRVKPTKIGWQLCASSSCYTFETDVCPQCTHSMDMYWKLIISPPPWKKYISSKRSCQTGKPGSQPSRAPELEKSGVNCEGDPYLRKYEWLNCLHIILGNWLTITYWIFDCFASLTENRRETIFEWAFEEFELSFYQVLSNGTRNVMLGLVKWLPVPPASEGLI